MLAFFLVWSGVCKAQISEDAFLASAHTLVEKNHTEQALKTWLQAREILEEPSLKIGIAFVEFVARKNLEASYKMASDMYLWGLSAQKVSNNKESLEKEINRLQFLVDDDIYGHWKNLLAENDPQLYQELRQFWKEKDPTPTTVANERLIEHWQRIAYIRTYLGNEEDNLFKSDERAQIFLKYGQPDVQKGDDKLIRKRRGRASQELKNTSEVSPTLLGGYYGQSLIDNRKAFLKRENSNYIVWIYNKTALHDKLIYIFASSGAGTYGFKLTNNMSTILGINPSAKSLRNFYQELADVAPFFSAKLHELDLRASKDLNPYNKISRYLGTQLMMQAQAEMKAPRLRAPEETSTATQMMQDIPVEVHQYRLLDQQNQPYFATFVESNPHTAFWIDYIANYNDGRKNLTKDSLNSDSKLQYYDYSQALLLYDKSGELIQEYRDRPMVAAGPQNVSRSMFTIPAVSKGGKQIFEVQLMNMDSHSSYPVEGLPFPKELRGLGKKIVEQPEALANDPTRLQMGDLIVGYNYLDSVDNRNALPFTVANNHKIPMDEEMVVHVELYHLNKNEEGMYDANLSYSIVPNSTGILSWFKKEEEKLKLTLDMQSHSSRYVENLRIKTRELKPGNYTLTIVATDPTTGQKVKREFNFEVKELANSN